MFSDDDVLEVRGPEPVQQLTAMNTYNKTTWPYG